MHGVGVFCGHVPGRKCELGRIGESGHAFVPVCAAEHDGVPLFVHVGGRVAEIGDCSVKDPCAAAVEAGRVASVAVKSLIKLLAAGDGGGVPYLFRRHRHRRDDVSRRRERQRSADLERQQTRRPALGLRRGHGPCRSEQARSASPAHGNQYILLAIDAIADGNGINRRPGLDRPDFLAAVGGISGELAGALSLKNKIAGGRKHAAVGGDGHLR